MKISHLDKKSKGVQSIPQPQDIHSRSDSLKENTLESPDQSKVTPNSSHSKMSPIIDSKYTELKTDLDKTDIECQRSSSKSVPIPCHSKQKGDHDEFGVSLD